MHTKFKLVGLSKKPQMFTLQTDDKEEQFKAYKSHLSEEQYSALFHLAKNTDGVWEGNNYCVIEHDGYNNDDVTPRDPMVIKVFLDI